MTQHHLRHVRQGLLGLGCLMVSPWLSSSVWAMESELLDLTLQPVGKQLKLDLNWIQAETAPGFAYRHMNDRTFVLEFPNSRLSATAQSQFPQAFPELGIQAVTLVQTPQAVQMQIITAYPLDTLGKQIQVHHQPLPTDNQSSHRQRFEISFPQVLSSQDAGSVSYANQSGSGVQIAANPINSVNSSLSVPDPVSSAISLPTVNSPTLTSTGPEDPKQHTERLLRKIRGQAQESSQPDLAPSPPSQAISPTFTPPPVEFQQPQQNIPPSAQFSSIPPAEPFLKPDPSWIQAAVTPPSQPSSTPQAAVAVPQAPIQPLPIDIPPPSIPQNSVPLSAQAPVSVPFPTLPPIPSQVPVPSPSSPPVEAPVILTPSLKQNQPSNLDQDPRFFAPSIQELPPASQNAPQLSDELVEPESFFGQLNDSEIVPPLSLNSLAPFPELKPAQIALLPPESPSPEDPSLSPLERPATSLFGFETATTLKQKELLVSLGGTSFANRNGLPTLNLDDPENPTFDEPGRSNDLRLRFDYGITDRWQLTLGIEGKDDTVIFDLVNPESGLSFVYQGIPLQLKWQAYEGDKVSTAVVLGAQFPYNTVPAGSEVQQLSQDPSSRKIFYSNSLEIEDAILAEDSSTHLSLAVPITYQVSRRGRLHINPQMSIFPDRIPVTNRVGDREDVVEANIGFDGDTLQYFGTVLGLGLGFDYELNPRLTFSGDVTPILSGRNMIADTDNDSLFVSTPVWNVGVKFVPNNRLGFNLYATNRFAPVSGSPANLIAQPGGDSGIAMDFIYLPDLGTNYAITKRKTYPKASAFFSGINTFSTAVLPIGSTSYEIAYGTNGRFAQTTHFGLLDDLELVLNYSSVSRSESNQSASPEAGLFGRLAVIPDRGQTGLAAAIGAGLLTFGGADGSTEVVVYSEFPFSFRSARSSANLMLTPKFIVPNQTTSLTSNLIGITVGTRWTLGESTEFIGEYTPILQGDNQLVNEPGQIVDGGSSVYGLGLRKLFETDNSAYALDLYWGNSPGNYGFQGLTALPNGETQLGVRFNVLNGIPGRDPSP